MTSTQLETLDMAPLGKILESAEATDSDNLIPILQAIQMAYGYLPPPILQELSSQTKIPVSRIFGVATFYEQFHLEPRGRHTIKCCRGTACHVKGAADMISAIRLHVGVDEGGTTEDMRFTFETVACLGTCFLAPVMMVNNDYYGHLTPDEVKRILERYS